MARPHSLKVTETVRADGTTRFSTRLMVDGERVTIDLGDERDGATPLSAARKLKDVLEDIRLGRWEPPAEAKAPKREPGFAEAARMYLEFKRSRQLRSSTMNRLTWAFETHLIPFFKNRRPSRITERDVVAYTDHQIEQRNRIVHFREQDKYLTGPNGGALRELSDATINSTLVYLTGLLTWAASNGWGDPLANPAASWRLKERPRLKAALEADELADLIEAAGTPRPLQRQRPHVAARAELIVRLRDEDGLPWKAILKRVGVAESTAIYNYQEAKRRQAGLGFDTRRAEADAVFVLVLAGTGLRVTELCDLDIGDVDLRPRQAPSPRRQDRGRSPRGLPHRPPRGRHHDLLQVTRPDEPRRPRLPRQQRPPPRQGPGQRPGLRTRNATRQRPPPGARRATPTPRHAPHPPPHLHQPGPGDRLLSPLRHAASRPPRPPHDHARLRQSLRPPRPRLAGCRVRPASRSPAR